MTHSVTLNIIPTSAMRFVFCSSSVLLLPSILIFIFAFRTSFCTANSTWYTNCSQPFKCGALENISYPFWGLNRPEYCGQPEFNLDCQDNIPKIKMLENTFRVLNISQQHQTFKVARDDYWDGICPAELINTTIDSHHFSYVPSLHNLSLYYNCYSHNSDPYHNPPPPSQFSCTTQVLFSFDEFRPAYLKECVSNVIIPVSETAAVDLLQNPTIINDTVKQGFDLKWKVSNDQCDKCSNSGGFCGYNVTTTLFTCFCQENQSWPNTCPSKTGMSRVAANSLPLSWLPRFRSLIRFIVG